MERVTLRRLKAMSTAVKPALIAIANFIARGTVTRVVDSGGRQELQAEILDTEIAEDLEVYGLYGFNSVPLEGAQCVVAFQGADGAEPIVVGITDRRHRPTGQPAGTVQLYSDTGATLTITADGDVVATPASGRKVLLGSSSASDAVTLASEIAALKTIFDAHIHVTSATIGAGPALGIISPTATPFPSSPGATKVDAE